MTDVWFRKSTLFVWFLLIVVALLVPALLGAQRVGTQRLGFPFLFYSSSSASPPAFGSTISWPWLVADLLVYYLVAVVLLYLIDLMKRGRA